jgi:hypothetical protein
MPGKWIRRPQGAAASAVFVHGILSSGETCWRNDNGSYWPDLLKNEPELGSLGIFYLRNGDLQRQLPSKRHCG